MRGSFFSASPWARQPLRPVTRRMGQEVVCDGDVCRITRPPAQTEPPSTTTTPTTTPPPSTTPVATESSFPVVPVVAGLGGIALLALLLRG